MSSFMLAAQSSALSNALLGTRSFYTPAGFQAVAPFHIDDTAIQQPSTTAGVTAHTWTAGTQVIFNLPKTASLIGKVWVEWTMGAGTTTAPSYTPAVPAVIGATNTQVAASLAGGNIAAAYIKNFGDLFFEWYSLRYGTNELQRTFTEYQVINRRLCKNDVNIEDINVNVLGGLPAGGAGEQVRIDLFYSGGLVRFPLEELYFTSSQDIHWMPESLALEGQIILNTRSPAKLYYTKSGTASDIVTPPTFGGCQMRYQEIVISAAEKAMRLAVYKQPEGHVIHFLDTETTAFGMTAGTGDGGLAASPATIAVHVPLSSFRMDMAEIVFVARYSRASPTIALGPTPNLSGCLADYKGDMLECNAALSLVTGNSVAACIPIVSYQLLANNKQIFTTPTTDDLTNRTLIRKFYHPDSQTSDAYYIIPFARYPEDRKNVTGFKSAAALGNMVLIVNVANPGSGFDVQVDAWCHSHNLIQARAGSMVKALN